WRVRRRDLLRPGADRLPQGRRDHLLPGGVHHHGLRRTPGQGDAVLVRPRPRDGQDPADVLVREGTRRRQDRPRPPRGPPRRLIPGRVAVPRGAPASSPGPASFLPWPPGDAPPASAPRPT